MQNDFAFAEDCGGENRQNCVFCALNGDLTVQSVSSVYDKLLHNISPFLLFDLYYAEKEKLLKTHFFISSSRALKTLSGVSGT